MKIKDGRDWSALNINDQAKHRALDASLRVAYRAVNIVIGIVVMANVIVIVIVGRVDVPLRGWMVGVAGRSRWFSEWLNQPYRGRSESLESCRLAVVNRGKPW